MSAALPGLPAVACFDTALPHHDPGRRAHLRAAGRVARALGPAALRLPRPVARVGRAAGATRRRVRQLPPRRRRVAVRDPRRPLGRHDDGLHAAGGAGDGDALGQRRSRARAVAARARRLGRGELADALEHESGPARAGGHRRHARGARRARPTATSARSSVATSTSTACAPGSPRWPRRSAGSTRWSSPAASASARRSCGRAPPTASASSAWRSTPQANAGAEPDADISAAHATVATHVIAAREDREIARQVRVLLSD